MTAVWNPADIDVRDDWVDTVPLDYTPRLLTIGAVAGAVACLIGLRNHAR